MKPTGHLKAESLIEFLKICFDLFLHSKQSILQKASLLKELLSVVCSATTF